jgi:hypothetical protein
LARSKENRGFICLACNRRVKPLTNGSYRNHCPFCLTSRHVDEAPGDRAGRCFGLMDAVAMHWSSRKGWQLLHRCRRCGVERLNRVAEDTEQPDGIEALLGLVERVSRLQRDARRDRPERRRR